MYFYGNSEKKNKFCLLYHRNCRFKSNFYVPTLDFFPFLLPLFFSRAILRGIITWQWISSFEQNVFNKKAISKIKLMCNAGVQVPTYAWDDVLETIHLRSFFLFARSYQLPVLSSSRPKKPPFFDIDMWRWRKTDTRGRNELDNGDCIFCGRGYQLIVASVVDAHTNRSNNWSNRIDGDDDDHPRMMPKRVEE